MIGVSKVSIAARPHRGMFQRPGPPVPDGTGYVQSWIDLPPAVYARITPATQAALERVSQGTVLSMATHLMMIPYRNDLNTKVRFTLDGRTLSVLGIYDDDERHVELTLICAEVVE
jgi:SPP1 family predicted phage head-tail adaptor